MNWQARISVLPKAEVLDPQGVAICAALHHLAMTAVSEVRSGRYFDLRLSAATQAEAERLVSEACTKLLANTVVETFSFDLTLQAEEHGS